VFEAAADWLNSDDAKFWNSVEYQASW
jgi:hypothetical protein